MKSTILGLCIASLFMSASAYSDQFYIDVGKDWDDSSNGNGNTDVAAGDTSTGWLDTASYNYISTSTVGCSIVVIAAGNQCSISSSGGIDPSSNTSFESTIGGNIVTAFTPNEVDSVFGADQNSNNGYGSDAWRITFSFDITGTATLSDNGTADTSDDSLVANYTSGLIKFYYYDQPSLVSYANNNMTDMSFLKELFTIDVIGTDNILGQGQFLRGKIASVGSEELNGGVLAKDAFNFRNGSFGDLLGSEINISAILDFNTDPIDQTDFDPSQNFFDIAGDHNGSIKFAPIPEPSTIALMGLGLLGMVGASRRRLNK